ncbi:Uncharacterised protein [uncultured archaeon]|nr:Uncharacterised protein [uncultured archaeon]
MHWALLPAIVGLILFAYAGAILKPPTAQISDISSADLDKNLLIVGRIERVHVFDGGSVAVTLRDNTGKVEVYVPLNLVGDIKPSINETVQVVGTVALYRGQIEVVAQHVERQK